MFCKEEINEYNKNSFHHIVVKIINVLEKTSRLFDVITLNG